MPSVSCLGDSYCQEQSFTFLPLYPSEPHLFFFFFKQMLPSNIEQFISDLLSMGSLQLYHTRKKHLIMKKNFFFFFFLRNLPFREKKMDWYERIDRVLWLLQHCEFQPPLDILLVAQNQLICPNCLFSIREKTLSSLRFPVLNHHHHNLTAAAFRTSSLTCFSFACICNPSVTCPFISSILTSHINPLTSLLPLATFSAPSTDLTPGQLLAKTTERDSYQPVLLVSNGLPISPLKVLPP